MPHDWASILMGVRGRLEKMIVWGRGMPSTIGETLIGYLRLISVLGKDPHSA